MALGCVAGAKYRAKAKLLEAGTLVALTARRSTVARSANHLLDFSAAGMRNNESRWHLGFNVRDDAQFGSNVSEDTTVDFSARDDARLCIAASKGFEECRNDLETR